MFVHLNQNEMKNFITASIMLFIVATSSIAQRGLQLMKNGIFESVQGQFKVYVNEYHIIIYDVAEPKKDELVHNISFLELGGTQTNRARLKTIEKIKPTLFGNHISEKFFGIFEVIYDNKNKKRTIHHHMVFADGNQKTKEVCSFKDDQADNPQYFFSSEGNNKFHGIYLLRAKGNKGMSTANIVLLDAEYNQISSKNIEFKEQISTNFQNLLLVSSEGQMIILHEFLDSKDGNLCNFYHINLTQDNSVLAKTNIYKDNSLELGSYRCYFDERGNLQLFGIFKSKSDRSRISFMNITYFTNGVKFMRENRLNIPITDKHQVAGILPVNDKLTVYAALSEDMTTNNNNATQNNNGPTVTAPTASNQRTESDEELRRKKEELLRQQNGQNNERVENNYRNPNSIKTITFYCTDNSGKLIWQNSFKMAIESSYLERFRFHDLAKSYSYWSDQENLYCLYNAIPTATPATSIGANAAQPLKLVPFIRTYNLSTGKYTDKPFELRESIPDMILLTGLLNLSSPKFGVSMVSVGQNRYMPTLVRW
jgi:hypothetical protein